MLAQLFSAESMGEGATMGAEELLDGFMKIVAVVYLLVLIGYVAKEMYYSFIIGQQERKEYKARMRAWKPEPISAGKKESKQPASTAENSENAALDPL